MNLSLPVFRRLVLLPVFLLLSFTSFAAEHEPATGLTIKIGRAKASGTRFEPVNLFTNIRADRHATILKEETLLKPLAGQVSTLYDRRPAAVSLTMKADNGKVYELEMLAAHPVAAKPNMGVYDATGRHQAAYTEGLHYQGIVAGAARSMASMSVFANGDIMMLFATEEGNFNVGKLENQSGNYIFYNDRDMLEKIEKPCAVSDNDYPADKQPTAAKGTPALLCQKVQLYWEADYDLFTRRGGTLVAAQNYMTALFNQMQTLYANDHIVVELKSLYIWTISDDYPSAYSYDALYTFKDFWNKLGNAYDGNIAHLITMDNNRNGGLGYVGVLCNRGEGFSYSELEGTYRTLPTYSWDAMVVSHETGHNFGSLHTRWCGWNTGAGGSCGAIDNCMGGESGNGCTTCASLFNISTPGWQGTIMSYCHNISVGTNLANGFGPIPGAYIRDEASNSPCLDPVISAILTPTPICDSDGAVTLTMAPDNLGVAPFSYSWSTNAFTQNISGITTAGIYSVQITDANACTQIFDVNVTGAQKSGNGIPLSEQMPICCQSTTRNITLRATNPAGINDTCQTIQWLKTTTPINNVTAFRTAFGAAQAGDLFASTNTAAISQSVGATLEIQPPVTCAAPVTYYYTPFVSRKPISALTVTGNTQPDTVYAISLIPMGSQAKMGSQTSLVTGCHLIDTPGAQSLVVTVSGYTGRANKMILDILDANDDVLYTQLRLPGNGAYNIPMSVFKGDPLQGIRIRAYDFNCSLGCIRSASNIRAERIVRYDSVTAPVYTSPGNCAIGTSIRVDFAPGGCNSLSTSAITLSAGTATLYPSPASRSVTLKITATAPGRSMMKITDVVGRLVVAKPIQYMGGTYLEEINVANWARGVYFVSLSGDGVRANSLKLVVE